jgi:hypothetical protein
MERVGPKARPAGGVAIAALSDPLSAISQSREHSYVTALARNGVPVETLQSLTRHSTPMLIFGVYNHVGLDDQAAALHALPVPMGTASDLESGAGVAEPISKGFAAHGPHTGDKCRQIVSAAGGRDDVKVGSDLSVPMSPTFWRMTLWTPRGGLWRHLAERRGWDSNPRWV